MVYQGSKTKLAKDIVPILQSYIDKNNIKIFVDGMCGGCNVIDKIKCDVKIANDINPYLIELYKDAISNPDILPDTISREEFNRVKNNIENEELWYVGLVSIFASFNTKGFVGGYATPSVGRDQINERIRNFKKQIPLLADISFVNEDINNFEIVNSLIYLDPPYRNTTGYDFSKNFDYNKFYETVKRLSQDNIVIFSEQEAPEEFTPIWEKEIKRNIHKNIKIVTERLYTYSSI